MNLYVGNLASDVTSEDLKKLFSEFGTIVNARIIFDHATNTPRGFGFVEFADKHAGFEAIIAIDMTYFMGQVITVKQAKSSTDAKTPGTGNSRMGGGGNHRSGSGGQRRDGSGHQRSNNYGSSPRREGGGYRRDNTDGSYNNRQRQDGGSYQDRNRPDNSRRPQQDPNNLQNGGYRDNNINSGPYQKDEDLGL